MFSYYDDATLHRRNVFHVACAFLLCEKKKKKVSEANELFSIKSRF